jgi:MarR family transcriptional regulator, organic hydroperoxide resistance regulator
VTVSVPPPAATADEFSLAWEAFFRATRRARGRSTGPLEGARLSLAQYQLLEALRATPRLPVSELAASAGVAPPTATRMLDALVRDGLAARTPCTDDRRVVHIGLTAAGREAVAEAAERVAAGRARVRDQLSPAEQAQAAALLRRLADIVEEQL